MGMCAGNATTWMGGPILESSYYPNEYANNVITGWENGDPEYGDIEVDTYEFVGTGVDYISGGQSGGGTGATPANNGPQTSTCTVSNGRTTAVSPQQEQNLGAGPFGVPPAGSVAIDPWALGLLPGANTNNLLRPYASQITFTFSPTPNLPSGFPTTLTLGSIVGPPSVRVGGSQFNGLFVFDIFGLPSNAAVGAATSPPGLAVAVTVTYPSSLPINCGGPIWDPIPPSPGIS
jgi:hypothetical protein